MDDSYSKSLTGRIEKGPFARIARVGALWAAALLWAAPGMAAVTLISTNADWRFLPGTNEASLPDTTAWRFLAFDESGWEVRPATFYYGETNCTGTELTDMRNGYTSFYLRKTFTTQYAMEVASLTIRAACDDGFVAWINGTNVASKYPPSGEILHDSVATGYGDEPPPFETHLLPDPANYLRDGTNLLAIQVFNSSIGSSDLLFDAELLAEMKPEVLLGVSGVSPAPALVTNLSQITVTFTEVVAGVDAADLLVNGVGATNVVGSAATYAFTFPQPAFGPVLVSWAPYNEITTVAVPPRTLLPSTPGVTWGYELVDLRAPQVFAVHPATNCVVRILTQVELWFDKPVLGVDAADLLMNGQAPTNLSGVGAGPYVFQFPSPPSGQVTFAWANGHGIVSQAPPSGPFLGGAWSCAVDPLRPAGDVIISEFLAWNLSSWNDEDGERVGWIELYNRGESPVDLTDWALTDTLLQPGKWVFEPSVLPPKGFLTVFASGKDRRIPGPGRPLHTNFKLSRDGEYLALYSPDSPRQAVCEFQPGYPEQGPDFSFGLTPSGEWRYLYPPTPDQPNAESTISNRVEAVHFSVGRGFYATPFHLSLSSPTLGAIIRYTLDGSVPSETNGVVYTAPILIDRSRIVRAAAFKKNHLTSPVITHTYFYNIPASQRLLPALSIVTTSNNLYGTSGIMETNPRNTTQHGIAWERPASAELIRPEDNGGFQVDCGLRIAGGDYIRTVYDYRGGPYSKYSFRLYFRGDYGSGRLQYPLFLGTTAESFDTVTLRAGMNDPTNPFIRDELLRQLESDAGLVASHGTFVNLFINGEYKGYYNPTERIDEDFLQTYHGGGRDWEIIDQTGEATEGTRVEWDALRQSVTNTDLTLAANYLELGRRMDLTNFVDYLLPHLYANTGDWPYNNWRAARERVTNGIFRFYAWDTEWSFGHSDNSAIGYSPSYTHNTITNQLSSTLVGVNMPWGWAFIQETFNQLKVRPEFKLLFADRVHKHLFNGGALTDESIRDRHNLLQALLTGTISNFDNSIATSWIPNRRPYLLSHLNQAGFLASSNAPVLSQFGGRVPNGFSLSMSCASGVLYYTTNGVDPRVMFSGALAPEAAFYSSPLTLTGSLVLKARTLDGTNWSALTEAAFQVEQLGLPLRITEIMYNPVGGDAYEFIELQNLGGVSINLQDFSFTGIDFRFPVGASSLAPGQRIVLASGNNPTAFATRYPTVTVAGYFVGSLSNGGERVTLLDPGGQTICSVDYDDAPPWPFEPDGLGYSLEIVDPLGDADDPANWHASAIGGGSPGEANAVPAPPMVRLNEVMALNVSAVTNGSTCPDWVELHNAGASSVNLQSWSLSDGGNPRSFVFPAGTTIPAGGYRVVWCDSATNAPGLHTGFQLDSEGETVALFDAATSRVDVLTFGPQVADSTVGRLGTDRVWQLCEPSPNAPNEPATLGVQASLAINEFMASALAGQDDWLELHNLDASRPVPLCGLYLGVSNALCQLSSPGFIPPSGFVQLRADAQPGPNHLGFKLPASGDTLVLSDATGAELDRLTYGSQLDGVSAGRLPNGTGSLTRFPGSASPGASNYVATWTGPLLIEVLARNEGVLTNAAGQFRDWMELYNPNTTLFDLSGLSLSVGKPKPGEWTFPSGAAIPASGHVLIWCDPSTPPTTNAGSSFNCGRALNAEGDALYLFNPAGQIVDSVQFGFQLRDLSIGRSQGAWKLLAAPTPGASNAAPAALGDPANVRLNEWMAGPRDGNDWLELFNPNSLPVDLAWLHLTDDPSLSGQTNGLIGLLTFIAPHGFVKWIADNHPENGPNHLSFSLDDRGESLRLFSAFGQLLDAVDYLPQQENVSEGCWPDGAPNFVRFVTTATPGKSNYLPLGNVVLNELLTPELLT